jgi:CRISPR/Cas system CMR-associated protein Cmr5 small subunit
MKIVHEGVNIFYGFTTSTHIGLYSAINYRSSAVRGRLGANKILCKVSRPSVTLNKCVPSVAFFKSKIEKITTITKTMTYEKTAYALFSQLFLLRKINFKNSSSSFYT